MTGQKITRVEQMNIYAKRMYDMLSISRTHMLPPWESLSDDAKQVWAMAANYVWVQGWNQAMDHVKHNTKYAVLNDPGAMVVVRT